jgi:hypothetical protein
MRVPADHIRMGDVVRRGGIDYTVHAVHVRHNGFGRIVLHFTDGHALEVGEHDRIAVVGCASATDDEFEGL